MAPATRTPKLIGRGVAREVGGRVRGMEPGSPERGRALVTGDGQERDEPGVPPPSRGDKRRYFVLMGVCIGLFVLAWAVLDRYSVIAAIVVSAVALVIPPFAAIIANVTSATQRRGP
jgi:hypothetical protein